MAEQTGGDLDMTEIRPVHFVLSVLFGRRRRLETPEWLTV